MSKKKDGLSPEEEAQKKDEQYLSKNKSDIEEVVQMMIDGTTRAGVESKIEELKELVGREEQSRIFHTHKNGKKVPMSHKLSHMIKLSESMELHLKTLSHGENLHASLTGLVNSRIKVLGRVRERGLFK
jgi:hypothetical protein